jgi:MYXO-CTERM domain-containing protein
VAAGVCAFNGCDDGQVCDRLTGTCSEDPCLKTRCPSAEKCNSSTGQCEPRCAQGEVLCDDACINPQASREHCGAGGDCQGDNAGQNCGGEMVCSLGACTSGCSGDLIACEGACIDPSSDPKHCGAYDDCEGSKSGDECLPGTTCVSGSCRVPSKPNTPSEGKRLVATGGGGCACSVGPGSMNAPASHRAGLALLALGLLALFRRRRLLPRTAAEGLLIVTCAASAWLLDSGCKLNPICLDCGKDGGVQDSGITGDNPDARVIDEHDSGAGMTKTDGSVDSGGGAMKSDAGQPDAGCTGVELCNNKDDDCDGKIDEDADPAASGIDIQTNPSHCGGCGKQCMIEHAFNACVNGSCAIDTNSGNGGCDVGFYDLDHDAANGCEYRCVKSADDDKICDQRDNDCDGNIDEDVDPNTDPQNCGSCMLRCSFVHAPNGATCSMKECVLDDTKCEDGWRNIDHRQVTGCEYRCPVWPTVDELCNAIDDDCDGNIDEDVDMAADPRLGMTCGSDTGECKAGATTCVMGSPTCTGSIGPVNELCDGKDNDCDNKTDEDFTTATDIANCGSCGHACLLSSNVTNGHAVLACAGGQCQVGGCVGNFADRNGDYRDGCETPCTITGNEVCDGIDNDCNGMIDDNVTAPSVVCAARQTGVCDASADARNKLQTKGPKCTNGTLSCDPAGAGIANFEASEVSCDTLDNDCDGKVDEIHPEVGQACTAGQGVCKATGINVCDNNNMLGYRCNATAQQASTAEACDGLDNDCDGTVDNFPQPMSGSNISGFDLVNVGSNVLMMAYEASRPDATATNAGTQTQKPCSASGRLPWANVTWGEAEAACCALNSNGQCQAGNKGWRLCDSSTWASACKGPGTCTWAYTAQCAHAANVSTYQNTCLGAEGSNLVTCSDSSPCATTTGSSSFAQCAAVTSGGNVFDLSGNLKEWTFTSQGTNIYEQRGGSYNNLEPGRACDFNFTVGSTAFRFPTTGFRCCYYP